MRKRRLILHIGTHKTGTSYLQKLFLVNRDVLAAASVGLAEPPNPVTGDHHHLVDFLRKGPAGHDDFLASLDVGHDCTLLSSEVLLALFMNRLKQSRDLPALVRPRFDVSVVLFLRRQDFLKESVFAEVAAAWYQGDIRNENHYFYDFSAIVDRVADLFGAEALRLGIYRDDRPQDIAAEFLELCGLGHLAGRLAPIPRERVSLDRRTAALLGMCPKQDPSLVARIRQAAVACLAPDPCKYILSPTERRAFLERYVESNRRVARALRPDAEDYLTGAVPVPENWSPMEPFSPTEVADLVATLAGVPLAPRGV